MTSNRRRFHRADVAQGGSPVLERRYWPREPARDADAFLSWSVDGAHATTEAHLLDISAGGASVMIAGRPPRGVAFQFGLAAVPGVTVDGRAVALRTHGRAGWLILHIRFTAECPKALYDQAVDGDGDGLV